MNDEALKIKFDYMETCVARIRWYLEHAVTAYKTEEFTSGNLVFKGPDAIAYKCGAMYANIDSALSELNSIEKELKEV